MYSQLNKVCKLKKLYKKYFLKNYLSLICKYRSRWTILLWKRRNLFINKMPTLFTKWILIPKRQASGLHIKIFIIYILISALTSYSLWHTKALRLQNLILKRLKSTPSNHLTHILPCYKVIKMRLADNIVEFQFMNPLNTLYSYINIT